MVTFGKTDQNQVQGVDSWEGVLERCPQFSESGGVSWRGALVEAILDFEFALSAFAALISRDGASWAEVIWVEIFWSFSACKRRASGRTVGQKTAAASVAGPQPG